MKIEAKTGPSGAAGDRVSASAMPGRRPRLIAAVFDFGTLCLALAVAALLGTVYLLLRTSLGATDVRDVDAMVAFAAITAAIPAWTAWYALRVLGGASRGHAIAGLHVLGSNTGRLLRVLVHPLGAPLWLWMGALGGLIGGRGAALPFAIVAAAVLLGGGVSLALLLARPGTRTLHDRVSHTTLVR